MTFGERLKFLREQRGLFQKDIAELLNITVSTVSDYEKDRKNPKQDKLILLAEFYGTSTDYLLYGKEKDIDELDPEGVQILRRATNEISEAKRKQMFQIMKTFLKSDE